MRRRRPTVPVLAAAVLLFAWLATPPGAASAEIAAAQVVDRDSLRAFVRAAAHVAADCVARNADPYPCFEATFRPPGRWNDGRVSIFIYNVGRFGTAVSVFSTFHAAEPEIEGRDVYDLEDTRGVRFVEEMVHAADREGDFVEYHSDAPTVDGDEKYGSRTVGYVEWIPIASIPENPYSAFIGSAIHPDRPPRTRVLTCLGYGPDVTYAYNCMP